MNAGGDKGFFTEGAILWPFQIYITSIFSIFGYRWIMHFEKLIHLTDMDTDSKPLVKGAEGIKKILEQVLFKWL